MRKTIELIAMAEEKQDLSAWAQKLGLTKRALYTAKYRGCLSPAIAGALAEELGEDAAAWMVIAALEGERESACKTRMIKKFIAGSALALGSTTALAAPAIHAVNGVCALCQMQKKAKNHAQMQRSESKDLNRPGFPRRLGGSAIYATTPL